MKNFFKTLYKRLLCSHDYVMVSHTHEDDYDWHDDPFVRITKTFECPKCDKTINVSTIHYGE